jgi:hypothetical protein
MRIQNHTAGKGKERPREQVPVQHNQLWAWSMAAEAYCGVHLGAAAWGLPRDMQFVRRDICLSMVWCQRELYAVLSIRAVHS